MQRLHTRLETTALRSICSGDDRIASWILPRVSKESFSFDPCSDFYRRMMFLTNKNGEIPRWEDLLEDMAISEDSRDELAANPGSVVTTRREAKMVVERLDEYRRARVIFDMSREAARALREESVDISALTDSLGEMLSRARGTGNMEDSIFSFGGPRLDRRALMEVLNAPRDEFIPTGFRAFDSINQGVPRGSLMMLAGQTGAGKTVLANNIGMYQAPLGAKVAFVSLEMTRRENIRRSLSYLTRIPLQQINRIHEQDRSVRRQLADAYAEYHDRVRRNRGRYTLFTPDEDVSMEDILTFLKPRGYDNIIIDYMGLLKGMDGDDQWRKLGAAARMGKRFTAGDQSIVTLVAQLSEEGLLRYSRTMQEHASLMWTFTRNQQEREANMMTIRQPKARNLRAFDFTLKTEYHIMRLTDVYASEVDGRERGQRRASAPERRGAAATRPVERAENPVEHDLVAVL